LICAFTVGVVDREVERVLCGVFGQLDDRVDHLLDGGMAEHHAAQHLIFAQFLYLGFDHHHRVAGGGDDEIHPGLLHLVQRGVEDVLAVDHADAGAADRAHERRAGQDEGGRSGHQGDDVGIVFQIVRQDGADDLDLVLEALDEQRPDRPVDQARGQGLFLRRGAFAAREAAGDLAGGVEFFLVVDGEGEEVLTGFGGLCVYGGGQDHRLAVGREDRAIGLTGDAPGFQGQLAATPFDGLALDIEHLLLILSLIPTGGFHVGRIGDGVAFWPGCRILSKATGG
jgi:hypothetical protein